MSNKSFEHGSLDSELARLIQQERRAERRRKMRKVAPYAGVATAVLAGAGVLVALNAVAQNAQKVDREVTDLKYEIAKDGFELVGGVDIRDNNARVRILIPNESGSLCIRYVRAELERDASDAITDVTAYSYGRTIDQMYTEPYTFNNGPQLREDVGPNPCTAPILN